MDCDRTVFLIGAVCGVERGSPQEYGLMFLWLGMVVLVAAMLLLSWRIADRGLEARLPDWLWGPGGLLRDTRDRDLRRKVFVGGYQSVGESAWEDDMSVRADPVTRPRTVPGYRWSDGRGWVPDDE